MKEAYYFSHDSNAKDDPKCSQLIEDLGLEGYGIYWVLVEILRDQPAYSYPLKMIPIIARKYNTTTPKVDVVVKNYGLFQIQDDIFFSLSLNKRMEQKEAKSLKARESANKRWLQPQSDGNAFALQPQSDSNAIKERKVNESKEEEIKENEIINISPKVEPKQKTFKQFTIEDFKNDISMFKESYTSKTLNDFYTYWIEKNTKGIMKFQLNKTWETELRLKTWAKNEENFKPIQSYQKANNVQPEPLKQSNPLELLPNRITEIYNIGQLENLGQQKCKSMFGYITKETPDKFLNESEKWYKVLYL